MQNETTKPETRDAASGRVDPLVMCDESNAPEFYKKFYNENKIALLQYQSLRNNFNRLVTDVLGADYYNMAMDVYVADKICCEDITRKANKTIWQRIFNT